MILILKSSMTTDSKSVHVQSVSDPQVGSERDLLHFTSDWLYLDI